MIGGVSSTNSINGGVNDVRDHDLSPFTYQANEPTSVSSMSQATYKART
jgi:hypothetical protein